MVKHNITKPEELKAMVDAIDSVHELTVRSNALLIVQYSGVSSSTMEKNRLRIGHHQCYTINATINQYISSLSLTTLTILSPSNLCSFSPPFLPHPSQATFKQILRAMKPPLLTYAHYDAFKAAVHQPDLNERNMALGEALKPVENPP